MEKIKKDKVGVYNPYELPWDYTIEFPNTRTLAEYGNKVYNRYPARSIFLVPRSIISSNNNDNLRVLDPFMGSGTTAVEASVYNCKIFGTEMDPFARLIAEVSIFRISKKEYEEINEIFESILSNWEVCKIDRDLYPQLKNIEYWFDESIFTDLLKLKSYIYSYITNEKYLKFFKIVFADCIKPSSKMERQSTKPYISSKYKKEIKPVVESFKYSFEKHLKALSQYNIKNDIDPKIEWLSFDATDFITKEKIDIAITSPPYLNAFDYTQIIKIESAWVGTLHDGDIELLRRKQVGHSKRRSQEINPVVRSVFEDFYDKIVDSDKKSSKMSNLQIANTCLSYFNDIYKNLKCVRDALKDEGEYHMIIGDNIINGIIIPTHKLIAELGERIGFKWKYYYKYPIKDHRTSIPREGGRGKIKYEFVIVLKK